jgi:hypothetical protein
MAHKLVALFALALVAFTHMTTAKPQAAHKQGDGWEVRQNQIFDLPFFLFNSKKIRLQSYNSL